MVKTWMSVCSAVVFVVVLALGSVQCAAGQDKTPAEASRELVPGVAFETNWAGFIPAFVKINIHPAGGGTWTIEVQDDHGGKGPDICRDTGSLPPPCNGTQFFWTIIGPTMGDANDKVIIKRAANAPDCFGWDDLTILGPNTAVTSGSITCTLDANETKYGILWSYDVEFWRFVDGTWELKAKTDPRGILH